VAGDGKSFAIGLASSEWHSQKLLGDENSIGLRGQGQIFAEKLSLMEVSPALKIRLQ